jgi:hypothetical protein
MLRSLAATVTGFILWSVLWLSYNITLKKLAILPSDLTKPVDNTKALLLLIIGSIILSLIAGYSTSVIARSASIVPISLLGLLLLAVGIFVEAQNWGLMPLWYHLTFLALLIPSCFIGAWLRSS